MTKIIDCEVVSRSFGPVIALDEVSFTVPEGSILGLLGRNGSGKTTLMSLIAGHDRPTGGRVTVCGEESFESATVMPQVVFVRDNQRYPNRQNVQELLRIAPFLAPNWCQELADELIDRCRLPRTTPITTFSRGQMSLIAAMIGLASRAPVTLLDEPYLGLDTNARDIFHEVLLREQVRHPRTIVLSTHLIEQSEALFDRVIILDQGRVRIDVGSDDVPQQATVLTGAVDAVTTLVEHRVTLNSRAIGGFLTVTCEGPIDSALSSAARERAVDVRPTSLNELVTAYGVDGVELDATAKGTSL